ncbi:hypothetical protein LOC68_12615 [Blastopirellula sp. JC732]|uniref:Flagellar protein FliL n=1 Tax=Blastopirellula sediminis TaxID=2894196 RepID=A0A9X1MLI1_9BACT|nr:hypothetical protein [Blastopirellula sediminis]MCC9607469.1 hypothetical protein [Blastopirellula sediminis]MCC9629238.1 hypothetical protein [Blastopirellula sediminis]
MMTRSGIYLAAICWLLVASGCGEVPIQFRDVENLPKPTDPAEFDLGSFDITIPQDKTNSTIMLDFHAYVIMPKYQLEAFQAEFALKEHRLRNGIILNIREFTRSQLNEPELESVRNAIAKGVSDAIPEPKINAVGFYHFRFLEE